MTAVNQPRYYESLKPALEGLGKLNGFGIELLSTKNEVRKAGSQRASVGANGSRGRVTVWQAAHGRP
jgi:hypothetical protein